MTPPDLMAATQRRVAGVEALAVLATRLRADLEGLAIDPTVAGLIDRVVEQMGFPAESLATLPVAERAATLGYIRSFFRQAADLMEHPERPPGWVHDDPVVLQSAGRSSMSIAPLVGLVSRQLGDLAERLDAPGGTFLDVGTGVGWLAIALANQHPGLHVVGIDVWQPSLELARRNVADMKANVEVRRQDVCELEDRDAYDAAFMAGPFLPPAIVPEAVARVLTALRPNGWLYFGRYAPSDDPLSNLLTDLRTVRGGGAAWQEGQAVELLEAAGYRDVREIARTWPAPVRFVVGRKA